MLASTTQPVYRWTGPEFLAFASARPPNAKQGDQTCCSSLLHTCLLSPQVTQCARAPNKRFGLAIRTDNNASQGQGCVSCLRGGSGDERDSPQLPESNGQNIPTAMPSVNTPQQGQQQAAAAFRSQRGPPAGEHGGGKVFGGVALVTERSTATGGSTGRQCYSVLPDGTLRVGPHPSVSMSTITHQFARHTSRRGRAWLCSVFGCVGGAG